MKEKKERTGEDKKENLIIRREVIRCDKRKQRKEKRRKKEERGRKEREQ